MSLKLVDDQGRFIADIDQLRLDIIRAVTLEGDPAIAAKRLVITSAPPGGGFDIGEHDAHDHSGVPGAGEGPAGAKTHTLTTGEMPSHVHLERKNSATIGGLSGFGVDTSTSTEIDSGYSTASAGGGGAHNNLQPYVVVYMWKRTA